MQNLLHLRKDRKERSFNAKMPKVLIKNGTFITMRDDETVLHGSMVVDGDRITYLGENTPDGTFDTVIDGTYRVYLPGLVNTHGHAAMSLLRGYADDLALQVWLEEKMWPNEAKFTAEDVKWGTMLSVAEMLLGGTTAFVDMYDHMDQVAAVVEESGMRGCLTRGMIGLVPPEVQRAKLEEATAFVKAWHGKAGGRITTMMSPHAPYTCPPAFIEDIVQAAHELDQPIHIHMSETAREVAQNVEQYGERPVRHLEKLGVFERPCLVAHGVHLNDEEIAILAKYDVRVSHNPGSNLKLASGIARVPELMRAGVLVSLGTDSSASNNNLDLLEEVRFAALLHKGTTGDPTAVPALEALKMGTVYGAKSIWLDDVGTLEVGNKADFISINPERLHYYPHTNFVSHLVYAANSTDVMDVWVDGKQLVKDRELLTLDEERIKKEFTACFERVIGE